MDEVEGVYNGTYDYTQLKGDTGPLVYPGGFVVVYYLLYLITDFGKDILLGQYLFMGLYLAVAAIVLVLYKQSTKIPLKALFLLALSKRIHSIFVLRLFNDCFAMFFLYIAIYCFIKNKWSLGCLIYSFAVGIKMNIFLFAPGLFLLLLRRFGILGAVKKISLCAIVQVVLALPFITTNFAGYISRAFDLGRVFIYYWSVNWKFVPEDLFLSREWGLSLLGVTALCWVLLFFRKWILPFEKLSDVFTASGKKDLLSADYILFVLFTSNFVGIVFARSLHFQFYVWYFHTLPYLLWSTNLYTPLRLALMLVIEVVWNIFPSNAMGSLALFVSHLIILVALWFAPEVTPYGTVQATKTKKQ
eukprot:TRINITY_DN1143_c0_g5_i1.p1 TRINITY_DN1143_c0_g5~~TRINITY_DN1143_c0_g5_i1.p1  ORF type:complete len:414 (+),score=64.06 TRINITY_DN1143_c0_g5_i1:166-1242(+)